MLSCHSPARRRYALREAENCDVNLTNKRKERKNCFLLFNLNKIKKIPIYFHPHPNTHHSMLSITFFADHVHTTVRAFSILFLRGGKTNYSIFGDFFNATVNDFCGCRKKVAVCEFTNGNEGMKIYLLTSREEEETKMPFQPHAVEPK